jgi:hypothetical protein
MLVIFSKRERRIRQFVLGIEGDGRFLVGGQAGVNYQIGHQQQRQQHARRLRRRCGCRNWSVKVEYLFTDLGRNNRTYLLGTGPGFTITGREQNHVVRTGLNYKFDWGYGAPAPVVARY